MKQGQGWTLVAVLQSNFMMDEHVADHLYKLASRLHQDGGGQCSVKCQRGLGGVVRNLNKHSVMGSVSGPAFEAEILSEGREGKVTFVLPNTATTDRKKLN